MTRARPAETARVYLAALLAGDDPVRAVGGHYGCTAAAARQRIARARARGIDLASPTGPAGPFLLSRDPDGTWTIQSTDAPPAPEQPAELTPEERADARKLFETGGACPHCGGIHVRACPRVKAIEFSGAGIDGLPRIQRVEFWETWPQDAVLWPEDVQEPAQEPPESTA
ncbi:hypothetical protein GCM10023196_037060 [Actinoallomurus vinaceus]|uniref:Uncharacterized protein n=1 Tax=Actinoallomurus vinaceus TaxID=1080074 RepID=A0ABP8U9G2_9ACTN